MKLRKLFALFAALSIIFVCGLFYVTKNLNNGLDKNTIREEIKNNNWIHIKDKIPHYEQQIQTSLSKKYNTSSVSQMLYGATCPIQLDFIPHSTVQMLDMYNDMKFDNPDGGVWKQGWKIEIDEKMWNAQHKLEVFVVPHSHNDPGWVKTFEEYYRTETKHILDNMIDKLKEDKRRKFIWAEISFFSTWWDDLDQSSKDTVRSLVHSGQLEFVTGGWVMNDEANSHWISILNQLTVGHLWLRENLDYTPKSSWSIDPFGLSSTQAVLLKDMGLKNMLIQRVHYSVKKQLASKKQLEFQWRQLWDGKGETDMFTHLMPFYSYDIPHTCGPDPKVCCQFDFKRLPGYGLYCPWKIAPELITENNVAEKAEMLLDQYRKKSTLYKTNVVLIPLGDDFRFVQRNEWDVQYKNYQKLFDYINSKVYLNAHVKFGTLTDYFDAVQRDHSKQDFPSLSGDFFTYADRDDHYWSGYYTSRPFYKRMDRILLSYVRAGESLLSIAMLNDKLEHGSKLIKYGFLDNYLEQPRQALALFQHHDGITGTAKDHVVKDYGERMLTAIKKCQFVIQMCTNILLSNEDTDTLTSETMYYNIDDIRTEQDALPEQYTITIGGEVNTKKVVMYNPLTMSRKEVVTFIVSTPYIEVLDHELELVECQIAPYFEYGATMATSKYRLSFIVNVQAFSLIGYTIRAVPKSRTPTETFFSKVKIYNYNADVIAPTGFPNIEVHQTASDFSIQNSQVTASFNSLGLLKAIKIGSKTYPVHLDFATYGVKQAHERSGAYLFLPDRDSIPVKMEDTVIRVIEGPMYSSVWVHVPYVDHTVFLYDSQGADGLGLEVKNLVNIKLTSNFEIAMRLSTNIKNDEYFFTDLNGYQIIRRKRFKKLPIQANYYPVPTSMYIEDSNLRLTVLTASPVGGSSLKEGALEMMLDRRLIQDDNLGLGQGVLDNRPIIHAFRILLETRNHGCQTAVDSHPAGFHTLAAQASLLSLLNPLIRMLRNDDTDESSNQNFSYTIAPFGVDYSIPVLRGNIKSGSKNKVGVVFHRTMLDLCFTNTNQLSRFPISNGTVIISEMLPTVEYTHLTKSSLSFLKEEGVPELISQVSLCPMKSQAYLLSR